MSLVLNLEKRVEELERVVDALTSAYNEHLHKISGGPLVDIDTGRPNAQVVERRVTR